MPHHPTHRALAVDQRHLRGPFDVIGDVHACLDELVDLLGVLRYRADADGAWRSDTGRTAVFVGDLVDRGPSNSGVLRLVMRMVEAGTAFCVPGNHDLQLQAFLDREGPPLVYGLKETVAELEREPGSFRAAVRDFFHALPGHLVFDEGRLVVAHTGLPESLHGVDTAESRELAACGVVDGEIDPIDPNRRHPWVRDYRGEAVVVYGHTPVLEPVWQSRTIDIDTGCVYGWRLTALQWPARTLVAVPARRIYATRSRPFLPDSATPRA